MSSCLSSGTGRAYGFDLENIVKSPCTSSRTSHSSSPSSTLSESSNSPIAISTRKPRTPRKRPNQTYNEAAALLSTACPNIFSTKNLTRKNSNLSKFTKQHSYFFHEPPELLLPFRVTENSGFLLHQPVMEKPSLLIEPRIVNSCQSPGEIEFRGNWNCQSNSSNSMELCDDFDTESMLDEEMEEGIDSIMGDSNSNPNSRTANDEQTDNCFLNFNTCYGYPMGLGFGGNLEFNFGFGMRNGVKALRNVEEGNWWSFPTVDVASITSSASPPAKPKRAPAEKKKKKVEELMKRTESETTVNLNSGSEENSSPGNGIRLLLKLNYDNVLNAWSDKVSPLPEEISGPECPGNDIHARLAQIDLFSENGGLREASVMRYKEKRRTRLFSKKIRYQVRKVNADRRPRSKEWTSAAPNEAPFAGLSILSGRFVRRPNSPTCED